MDNPNIRPEIEIVVEAGDWPPKATLRKLARRAVTAACGALGEMAGNPSPTPPRKGEGKTLSELSIVFTDDAAMRALNKGWRGKDKPTNVLSFPQESAVLSASGAGAEARGMLLGDVILAAETVAKEAAVADKPLEDHMAHLIVHGFLHLLGYDHQDDAEAEKMEQLERVALKRMGIPDPYATAKRQ